MQAFLRFGCLSKTVPKTFISGSRCVPRKQNLQRPCVFHTCRKSLRNLFILARQYRGSCSKPTNFSFPFDKEKQKRLKAEHSKSISSILLRFFVSTVVSLFAVSFGGRLEALAARGKALESNSAPPIFNAYDSSVGKSSRYHSTMVKNTKVSEQSDVKHKTNNNSKEKKTPPAQAKLAKSEKLITWSLTLVVFAGVCFVLYRISLKEEEEEAKAIEREYQRLEQLKREFIESDDDSPVRDEDLLSSLRKRLENQTQQEDQGSSSEEVGEITNESTSVEGVETDNPPAGSVQGEEEVLSSEKATSSEGVSSEHLDMLRRMYEGTSVTNREEGNNNPDGNQDGDRNTPNDTRYDDKGSKGRKNRT
jgi:hypothetical protein